MGETVMVRDVPMYIEQYGEQNEQAIVLLHGFTGSTKTWDEVVRSLQETYHVIVVDLLGHGQTAAPKYSERYSMEQQVQDLNALFTQLQLENFILLGYSMGGRVALSYALSYPNDVRQLILESASPGLRTEEERLARRTADAKLAARIVEGGIEAFVNFWEEIPLFQSQKKLAENVQEHVRQERLAQRPDGLANSLKGVGTGSQPSNWGKLSTLQMPVLFVTGALDEKFVKIAEQMQNEIQHAVHETVPNVGHAIHVENPQLFVTIIKKHIF